MNENNGCGTVIGMWACLILGIVSLVFFAMNDAVPVGAISLIVFSVIGLSIFNNASPELKKKVAAIEQQAEYEKMNCGYKCPSCGKMAGHPIGAIDKGVSVGALGLASNKIGKTYKCAKCGYMW